MSKKSLAQNIMSLGIIQIANFVMPLISVPIISRIIGPEKFGAINYVGALIVYFNLFIGYGFNLTATRRLLKDPDNKDLRNQIFSEVFYCQLFLFLITFLLFSIFLYTIPNLASEKKMSVFSFLFCISSVLTQNWFFQAMQDMSKVTIINLLGKVLYLIAVLALIKEKEDYYWQPLSLSLTQISVGFISFYWVKSKYEIKFVAVHVKKCLMLLWNEKAIFFSIAFTTLYTTANIIILGLFQSKADVGFYTAGQRLIVVAQSVIVMPLSQVFYPYISKNFSEEREKGIRTVQKLFPIVILFTGFIGLCILIAGPYVLRIFYGDSFLPAIPVFQILAFVPMINAVNNIMGIQVMLNMKMDKQYLNVIAIGAVLSISANMIMANHWSYIGCAVNWLATEILIAILMYFSVSKTGINLINLNYFTLYSILGYLKPLQNKLSKKTNLAP